MIAALLMVCYFLVAVPQGAAQSADAPDTGLSDGDLFLSDLDVLCGVGDERGESSLLSALRLIPHPEHRAMLTTQVRTLPFVLS